MAINGNIGKITTAIQQGRTAFENLDFGPVIPASVMGIDGPSADWGTVDLNPNVFIFGIHRWGDLNFRVTK